MNVNMNIKNIYIIYNAALSDYINMSSDENCMEHKTRNCKCFQLDYFNTSREDGQRHINVQHQYNKCRLH